MYANRLERQGRLDPEGEDCLPARPELARVLQHAPVPRVELRARYEVAGVHRLPLAAAADRHGHHVRRRRVRPASVAVADESVDEVDARGEVHGAGAARREEPGVEDALEGPLEVRRVAHRRRADREGARVARLEEGLT